MTALWVFAGIATAVGVGIGWNGRVRRQWRQVAKRLNLRFSEESYWLKWEVAGQVRGCSVRLVNSFHGFRQHIHSILTVQRSPPISTEIVLRSENLKTRTMKLVLGQDVQLGDDAFDRAVWMSGPATQLYGVLDARTRTTVLRIFTTWGVEIEGGAAHLHARSILTKAKDIEALMLDTVSLVERLGPPPDGYVAAALQTLADDPDVKLRRACLAHLLANEARDRRAIARIGMQDGDPDVRLKAALAADAEGIPTLEALLDWGAPTTESARPPTVGRARWFSPTDAAAVVEAFHTHAPEKARGLVNRVLRAHPGALTDPAVRLAATLNMREHIPLLNRIAQVTAHQAAVVDALRLFGDPAGEPALIEAIGNSDAEVRRRAIDALGHFGTRAAVVPLRGVTDRATRGVAAQAIARIANREAPGRGGGLSVVDDAQGGLSTTVEGGALSDAGKDA